MKVCKLNRQCNFAVSSYLLGVGTQSCYNTEKCPYGDIKEPTLYGEDYSGKRNECRTLYVKDLLRSHNV